MDSGAYAIILYLSATQEIQIAKLGKFKFPSGCYIYSGSAKKNLLKRVQRHLGKDNKKLKWHIDFFINNSYVKTAGYYLFFKKEECEINRFFKKKGGKVLIKKFGASDCKDGCLSHFLYLGESVGISKNKIKKFGGVNGGLPFLQYYQ